jgi:hypothetical protein
MENDITIDKKNSLKCSKKCSYYNKNIWYLYDEYDNSNIKQKYARCEKFKVQHTHLKSEPIITNGNRCIECIDFTNNVEHPLALKQDRYKKYCNENCTNYTIKNKIITLTQQKIWLFFIKTNSYTKNIEYPYCTEFNEYLEIEDKFAEQKYLETRWLSEFDHIIPHKESIINHRFLRCNNCIEKYGKGNIIRRYIHNKLEE